MYGPMSSYRMSSHLASTAEPAVHENAIVAGVIGDQSANAVARARRLAREKHASLYVVRLDPGARRSAQAAALSAVAEDARAALVVVSGRSSRIAKSLTEQVHDETSASLLHVRNVARAHYAHVVLAVDTTSRIAEMVAAARFVAPSVAKLDYLHFFDTPYEPMLVRHGAGHVDIRAYRADARKDARERIVARFAEAGVALEPHALSFQAGNPRVLLVERVPARALLVIQRGRSRLRHFVFGSVTRAVIRGAGPDVLIV